TAGDCAAIRRVINAGVKIITSAHGYSVSDLQCRKEVLDLIKEGVFERYIVLSRLTGPGTIEEVADSNLQALYRRKANAS
ncbi:MAG: stage III sporulation protein AA, partial [Eubacteriales bacterium]|nr:stage III sporulation protein AA [Eubacteriales bacterium]